MDPMFMMEKVKIRSWKLEWMGEKCYGISAISLAFHTVSHTVILHQQIKRLIS